MNASKQEATKAQVKLERVIELIKNHVRDQSWSEHMRMELDEVHQFLTAAQKKLPNEKSFEAERQRRRSSKKKATNVWPPNRFTYHKPSAAHPASCEGCTTDEAKWGKLVAKGEE